MRQARQKVCIKNDHSSDLSSRFEAEYFADMKALGIKDPDVLVRVTEYVPYIVEYVQKIIDRGYA